MDNLHNMDIPNISGIVYDVGNLKSITDPMKNFIPRSVLILGNGFDLDLGIQTKYNQFANNKDFWPFKDSDPFDEDSLPYFLNRMKNEVDTWFDLEELLACYANESQNLSKEKFLQVKQDFSVLSKALKEYLIKQEEDYVERMQNTLARTQSMTPAHRMLQLFQKKQVRTIYTFNYTNTSRIVKQLFLEFDGIINHVHGSTREDNIILGTGDQRFIRDDFFIFNKSASPNYKSNNLVEDLNSADEVYIFGHSLGKNDHDYFSEFFKMASKTANRPLKPDKIKIRIFTLNDNSEIELKKQLMILTDNHLIGLYAHSDFEILKTDVKYRDWMTRGDNI